MRGKDHSLPSYLYKMSPIFSSFSLDSRVYATVLVLFVLQKILVCVWESVCVRKYVCMCEQVIEREKQGVKCHRPWTVWIRGGHFTSGPKQYSLIHNGQKNSNSSLSIFIFCFLLVFALWLSNSEERKKYRQLYFLFLKRSAFLKKDF